MYVKIRSRRLGFWILLPVGIHLIFIIVDLGHIFP